MSSSARYFIAGMHIICMFPHIIIAGIPIDIIFIIDSHMERICSMLMPSIGIILQTMPSLVISQVILHIMGIIIGIMPIIGIIPFIAFIIGMFIMGFMPFMPIGMFIIGIIPLIAFIIGIVPIVPIIGFIGIIPGPMPIPFIGMLMLFGIGMFIGIAGIMVSSTAGSLSPAPCVAPDQVAVEYARCARLAMNRLGCVAV